MSETRKSIKFSVLLDTSEVPQAVKNMQRQMEQANVGSRLSQQGFGGSSIPKPEDIQKSKTALMQFIREQQQQQERLFSIMHKQSEKVQMLNSLDKSSLRTDQEREKLLNRQLQAKEKMVGLEKAYDDRQKVLGKALDMQSGGGKTINENLTSMTKKFIVPAIVASVVAATAKAIVGYAALPRDITVATGAATQGLVGNQLQNLQGGDLIKTMAFRKEWGESMQSASKERENANFMGAARIFSMKGMVGRLGGDASDMMDFISPGMGSATIGKMIKPYEQGYQADQSRAQMERAQEQYAAKMQGDPLKMAAVNKYSQNYMRDLQSQRMMGLSDSGYYGAGGFQERMNKGGFNDELGLGMAGQIQGAGGSTRGMGGLSLLGLQAQRGSDMTNAGSVLGRISGVAGSDKSSESIFKKLMEESVKAGLDKSEFREEQRRFTDTASEVLANSGVKTAADAANVLSGLSKFMGGEPTIKGIEGARGAYEQAQGITSQTGGRMGSMQSANFLKNPKLKGLGASGFGEFMEMPDQDMNASNPDIIAAAKQVNMSPEELAQTLKGIKRSSMLSTLGLNQTDVDEFSNSSEGRSFDPTSAKSVNGLSKKHYDTWRKIQSQVPFGFTYKNQQEKTAAEMGVLGRTSSDVVGGVDGGNGTRMGDSAVASSGQVAQEFLENFREFSKTITPSTEAVAEWTKMLIMSASVLRYTAEGDRAGAQKALADILAKGAKNQNQVTR